MSSYPNVVVTPLSVRVRTFDPASYVYWCWERSWFDELNSLIHSTRERLS